ncbi:glycosyltransferase [Methylotenera versatilis]|uniref:glycosyltransferase n=1 Tax=Methylotenera versatilis TaxID=1055487 RepID=UPI00190F5F16|nr:glycosyltransferase [Methylotenera versatilis]
MDKKRLIKGSVLKISIAVPSFNYREYIDECLMSIQQQAYSNFEVLIADGGSKDGTLEIIQDYCLKDSRFRLVSTDDNGQADAIQKAFEVATGDIFCFLNADDMYLCNDVFVSVIRAFENHKKISLVSFSGYYLDDKGSWIKPINYRYHPLDGFHLMKYRTAVLQPATFWKKEVYESIDWPRSFHFVFDVVFFYAAYQKFSWLELTKPVAGYRLHGNNKSMTVRAGRIMELAIFEQIKFGQHSFRAYYLKLIGHLIKVLEKAGSVGTKLSKIIYMIVNALAFISCYRLPSI